MLIPPPFEARIVRGRALSPSVRELTFERTDGQPVAFEPGQWVNLILPAPPSTPGGEPSALKRSYSIASAPAGGSTFDVAVTHVQGGPGSTYLHEAPVGATLSCIGPQGFFTRAATTAWPSLFIATGTGVTPMRSMIQAALAHDSAARAVTAVTTAATTATTAPTSMAPLWLLLGVRREVDVLYAEEMAALAAEHPRLRFVPTLSQGSSDWTGRRGYVQTHVKALWAELAAAATHAGLEPPHAYICGLERMVGSVREVLRVELGLPRQQVHSERYD